MTNPAASHPGSMRPLTDLAPLEVTSDICRLSARCHEWLEEARNSTSSPGVQRLIDDLHDELYAIGPIDGDMQAVVQGALESVAAAIDADGSLLATVTVASLN